MELINFLTLFEERVPVGMILANPRKGTSKFLGFAHKNFLDLERRKAIYQRRESPIRVQMSALHKAYQYFLDKKVSSNDLKLYDPATFMTHGCNCTWLFMILKEMGKVHEINGQGTSGDPFWVNILPEERFLAIFRILYELSKNLNIRLLFVLL
ncbi:MAG: hypothetical protein NT002_02910 [candidate division Zixibacteria bacterium]|nr:hypothetical protein [candidate division Zixibacteria bacterium]